LKSGKTKAAMLLREITRLRGDLAAPSNPFALNFRFPYKGACRPRTPFSTNSQS
jgi:hypothetical protein